MTGVNESSGYEQVTVKNKGQDFSYTINYFFHSDDSEVGIRVWDIINYSSSDEARTHMTTITVRTWDLNSQGQKYTRSWSLMVHKNIAPTVKAIFEEIYALPEKPPIHSLGGYRWESKSEHSVGLALDLNARENGYFSPSGQLLYGKGFDPANDPYAIPVGGKIDQIFAKYGFTRGIYWRSGYKDYMHYSFFGT